MCIHISSCFEFQYNNCKIKQGSLSILELVRGGGGGGGNCPESLCPDTIREILEF